MSDFVNVIPSKVDYIQRIGDAWDDRDATLGRILGATNSRQTWLYHVPAGMDLDVGDWVVVPWGDRFQVAVVDSFASVDAAVRLEDRGILIHGVDQVLGQAWW